MFAMVLDRDPLRLQDVPGGFLYWIQNAGGWAAFCLLLWLLLKYTRMRDVERARIPVWQKLVCLAGIAVAAICYLPVLAVWVFAILAWAFSDKEFEYSQTMQIFQAICLTVGGAGALVAVGVPFVTNLAKLRFRRIGALAKLSFKEAIRSRVLYAFCALLLVFLFASWFIPHKPEDQVRSYVAVVYWCMTILLLVAAVLVSAFSIPTDIRNQTIHTIITKPVERFEILLGRFLGFTVLMTLVLLLMTTVSLTYVLRGIDPAAAAESLKAREPFYGELRFEGTHDEKQATNVGREWGYRTHITAPTPGQPTQYAVWDFPAPPNYLGKRNQVRSEFTFDIYRTTKGYENRGVTCEFEFQTANFDKTQKDNYQKERNQLRAQTNRPSDSEIDDQLAEKYGYFVVSAKEITDYHVQSIDVPAGLFRNAAKIASPSDAAPLQVRVRCRSMTQYVGMAKYDLYWRLDDPNSGGDNAAFALNFYKGTFGLWLRLCLVIGLSVALSTYLSGVITLLVTGVLYLGGMTIEFLQSLALGKSEGGGPMEALVRLANRQVGLIPLEDTTAARVATTSDSVFRWFIRRVLDLIPDVNRYDLSSYVAEGFNITLTQLLLDFGIMALYVLPWVVLAYYLMKWREIAAPT
jgi:ABC-type transport system involved in multi-copper enzyme maturation permease subunit